MKILSLVCLILSLAPLGWGIIIIIDTGLSLSERVPFVFVEFILFGLLLNLAIAMWKESSE